MSNSQLSRGVWPTKSIFRRGTFIKRLLIFVFTVDLYDRHYGLWVFYKVACLFQQAWVLPLLYFFSCLLIEPNQAIRKSAGCSDWERCQENSESKTVGNKWSPRAGAAERTDLTRQVRRDCNEGNLITFFCLRNQSTESKDLFKVSLS